MWRLGIAGVATAMLAGGAVQQAVAPVATRAATDETAACESGYRMVDTTRALVVADVSIVSADHATLVGGKRLFWGRTAATVTRYKDGKFTREASFTPTVDTGFVATDRTGTGSAWAVGFQRTFDEIAPLAARTDGGGSWSTVRVPTPGRSGAALTDVTTSRKRTWAVGYELRGAGRRKPLALQRKGGAWVAASPSLRGNENGMLSAVSTHKRGGTWIAGLVFKGSRTRPYIARRTASGWKRMDLPNLGDAVLADIAVTARDAGWAVGYRYADDGPRPVVLRWDGGSWREAARIDTGRGGAILLGLAVNDGVPTVSGARWSTTENEYRPFLASLSEGDWTTSTVRSLPSHAAMTSVGGDPSRGGLAVGSGIGIHGLVARTCRDQGDASHLIATADTPTTQAVASDTTDMATPSPTDEDAQPSASRVSDAAGPIRIRDRADAKGLPTTSPSWSAVIDDFDGDGRDDIFLGRHGGLARLYIDKGRTYQDAGVPFGRGDRHGCASADVDGSGLPDLYCLFGAVRGNAVKANQLWLDPGGPDPKLDPLVGGVPEPLGRGRHTTFIDADDDGQPDLFVGQKQGRVDGLPSSNRLFLHDGGTSFKAFGRSGIEPDNGSASVDTGDFDRDGRTDLLHVYFEQRAPRGRSGLKLYRNTPSGFRNVSKRWGIRSIGEVDAELARMDGDRRPDLIQLSENRIRVSLQRDGAFRNVYERRIPKAVAMAVGDIDGDGDRDIYVLRQKDTADVKDLVLINRGQGRSFNVVPAPSRKGGLADDVLAIDHNQNGTTDFLVLNGRGPGGGPLQLMTVD